jgi:hypothetical protein
MIGGGPSDHTDARPDVPPATEFDRALADFQKWTKAATHTRPKE